MPDETTTPAAPETAAPEVAPAAVAAQPAQTETDWKAEARKWEERAKANKAAADELAAFKASAETEKQTLEQKLAEIGKAAADRAAEAARYKVAATKGVPAELLPENGDEESLAAFADRVLAFRGEQRHVVPGVGNTPPKPPTAQEQARAAEAAGDFKSSLAAKTGLLAELAQGQAQ